jgi:hypothetical protein
MKNEFNRQFGPLKGFYEEKSEVRYQKKKAFSFTLGFLGCVRILF